MKIVSAKEHYDMLIQEENDPANDPPILRDYMNKWDGQPFIHALALNQESDVLEIGVGTGRLAKMVLEAGCRHFTGIDLSAATIDRAKENLSFFRNVSLIASKFADYVFLQTFDIIYCSLTLFHIEDKAAFIQNVANLLPLNGRFVCSIPKEKNESIEFEDRKVILFPDDIQTLSPLMTRLGFQINDIIDVELAHILVCQKVFSGDWFLKLQEIKDRLLQVPGMKREIQLEVGQVATETGLTLLENQLKVSLPHSFRWVLENIGASLYFSYFLNDFVLPEEFNEIFSGGLSWDIENLEFLNVINGAFLEEDEEEETRSYIQNLSHMLRFADSGNGDSYVFDMSAPAEEKPVLYWEHETGEFRYLADSFGQFLECIVALNFVGDEIWQLESFLDKDGLSPNNPSAKRWKLWFESLLKDRFEEKKSNLKSLFSYALTREKWDTALKEAFETYPLEEVFQMLQDKLAHTDDEDVKEILVNMISELIGRKAEQWIDTLWLQIKNTGEISQVDNITPQKIMSSELISQISSRCMEEEKAFRLSTDYLAECFGDKLTGSCACDHLKYFNAKYVIPWMEQQKIISVYGWDRLLMSVTPSWTDLLRLASDSKLKKVVIDGLALFIQDEEELTAPSELPSKETFMEILNEWKEKELLNIRKNKITMILSNIEVLYE